MTRTLTNTHRSGHQPDRARVNRAIGHAWQGRFGGLGHCAGANRSATWTYLARQANSTGASPAVLAFDGILTVPTMWTKSAARHLGTRST